MENLRFTDLIPAKYRGDMCKKDRRSRGPYSTMACKSTESVKSGSTKMVMKILVLAAVAGLTAGCAPLKPSGCHKTTAIGSCSSGRWDDRDEWGAQARAIRSAINVNLTDPQIWEGKKCRLHLEFAQDGTALNVSTSNGNKAYCEALKSAALKAKFPAFHNPEVFRDFEKSRFDMRG